MKRIELAAWLLLTVVSVSFVFSLNDTEQTLAWWALRKSLLYYTGIVAVVLMSVALLLAMRLSWLEPRLGGVDAHYRLHRWLAYGVIGFGIAHWLIKLAPKWLTRQGWVSAETFKTPPGVTDLFQDGQWLSSVKGLAEHMGEWGIYAFLPLTALALWQALPYGDFRRVHRSMAVVYLLLAFHSLVLMAKVGWLTPVGVVMALALSAGTWSAVRSLLGWVGRARQVHARVRERRWMPADRTLFVQLDVPKTWPGHRAGQFAWLTFDRREGHHPFTISSDGAPGQPISFHIKALGDHTRDLAERLQVGDAVLLEGPYGRFDFAPSDGPQIWVAGGIGITPFMARMQALQRPDSSASPDAVRLHWCVRDDSSPLVAEVSALAASAGVRLNLVCSGHGQTLHAQDLIDGHGDWRESSVWFCGPAGLGAGLREGLAKAGLPAGRFHQEWFDMR